MVRDDHALGSFWTVIRTLWFPLETKILPHYLTRARAQSDLRDDDVFRALFEAMARSYTFLAVNGGNPVPLPELWRELRAHPPPFSTA